LQQHHEALKNLLLMFCIRLADAERRIEVLAYRGAEERLGRLLLSLASSSERETGDDSGEITLPISHEELAQMAAMSRAHTTVTWENCASAVLFATSAGSRSSSTCLL